jgi:glutamate synthase domain-containing protein 2
MGCKGGTGASPEVVLEHAGLPTLAAVVIANGALEEVGLREEVDLVVSGGISSGADVAKAIALGADAVAISTAALVALGCKVCGLCNTGRCPYGDSNAGSPAEKASKCRGRAREGWQICYEPSRMRPLC